MVELQSELDTSKMPSDYDDPVKTLALALYNRVSAHPSLNVESITIRDSTVVLEQVSDPSVVIELCTPTERKQFDVTTVTGTNDMMAKRLY